MSDPCLSRRFCSYKSSWSPLAPSCHIDIHWNGHLPAIEILRDFHITIFEFVQSFVEIAPVNVYN